MSTLKGILGGFIGGMIAAIPWLIVGIYFEWMFSALAIPIAVGVNFGYRLFGGKLNRKLPIIIAVMSIVIIMFVTLIIYPLGMLNRLGVPADLSYLLRRYQNSEFAALVLKDLLVAVIFTGLGIAGVVKSVNDEVKNIIEI